MRKILAEMSSMRQTRDSVSSSGVPRLLEEELTYSVNGAGFEVYNTLGYGFLEHIYVRALELELMERGHRVSREYAAIVFYKGHELATQRMDLVVDEKLIVETKATQRLPPEAPRQLFNYLRATTFQVGLLLHFGPNGLGRIRLVSSNEFKPHESRSAVLQAHRSMVQEERTDSANWADRRG